MGKIMVLVVRLIGLAVVFGVSATTGSAHGKAAQLVFSGCVMGSWVVVSSVMEILISHVSGAGARRAIYVAVDAFVAAYAAGSMGVPLPAMIATFAGYLFFLTVVWGPLLGGLSAVSAVLGMTQLAVATEGIGLRHPALVAGAGALGLVTGFAWQICLRMLRRCGRAFPKEPGAADQAAAPGNTRELDELRKRLALISAQLEQVSQERDHALEAVTEMEGKMMELAFKSPPKPAPAPAPVPDAAPEASAPGAPAGAPAPETAPSSPAAQ